MRLGLQLKCDLTNVTDLNPNGQDFRWYVQPKCGNCGQDSSDFVYVCAAERVTLKGSRGDTNLAIRCKFCSRIGHVAVFECRGVELIAFSPRIGWTAVGTETKTFFGDISLSDDNWCDYDETGNCEVSVFNVESRFIKLK
ncbi:Ribosomal RNA assembly protein [Fasciola hepatica]|uniref:Ribosomal RNA assembly protein n=1 Tax=Fasciola hepatica TaxID=6192 RepID=A0A4E0RBC3_FASHE|nr:Ribosomal RNA assembly protein [Fasciola hepatica]